LLPVFDTQGLSDPEYVFETVFDTEGLSDPEGVLLPVFDTQGLSELECVFETVFDTEGLSEPECVFETVFDTQGLSEPECVFETVFDTQGLSDPEYVFETVFDTQGLSEPECVFEILADTEILSVPECVFETVFDTQGLSEPECVFEILADTEILSVPECVFETVFDTQGLSEPEYVFETLADTEILSVPECVFETVFDTQGLSEPECVFETLADKEGLSDIEYKAVCVTYDPEGVSVPVFDTVYGVELVETVGVFDFIFDNDSVLLDVDERLDSGVLLLLNEPIFDLEGFVVLDTDIVLELVIEVDTDKEALTEGDPESELVFVRNRLDSELHGLDEALPENDEENVSETLPEVDGVSERVDHALCVLVARFDTEWVELELIEAVDTALDEIELNPLVVADTLPVRVPIIDLEPVAETVPVLEEERDPVCVAVLKDDRVIKPEYVCVLVPELVFDTKEELLDVGLAVEVFDCRGDLVYDKVCKDDLVGYTLGVCVLLNIPV